MNRNVNTLRQVLNLLETYSFAADVTLEESNLLKKIIWQVEAIDEHLLLEDFLDFNVEDYGPKKSCT